MRKRPPNNITIVTRVDAITQKALEAYAERRKLPFASAIRDVLQRALKTHPTASLEKPPTKTPGEHNPAVEQPVR